MLVKHTALCFSGGSWHVCPRNSSTSYARFDTPRSWEDAKAACEKLGGHLAAPSDDETNTCTRRSAGTTSSHWIGVRTSGPGRLFRYSHNNGVVVYSNWATWAPGQPRVTSSAKCVSILSGLWSVSDCIQAKPFVCEKPGTYGT